MRDPKRIRKFCNDMAEIWETQCPDWRFGQLLVNVIDRDPWFLEEPDMLRKFKEYFHIEDTEQGDYDIYRKRGRNNELDE